MKISKYNHSCLLVEDQGKTILVDPGNYTYDTKALDINALKNLDAIAITHEHMDHMHIPLIQALLQKFPKVEVFGTNSIKNILAKENIVVNAEGNNFIKMNPVPHEKIFMGPVPENVMVTLFDKFASPGDSLTFDASPEILALPVQAPWGSTTWATETALKVKPKVIIPIHDWHWKDEVRKGIYGWLEAYFKQQNIVFLKPETGQVFEV